MLSDFTDYNSDLSDLAAELKDTPTKLTIVYSPVYDEYLEQIARSFMSLGDVYMGAEDLGYKGIDSEYGEGGDMGDLCYYIHLREENILDILQDMLIPKEEVQVLHSPDLYFYLRELTKEDYAWFFDKIKKESPYREVFWGAGNCFVANVDMLSFFDQVILIDSRKNPRQSIFCDRLERVLNINQGEPQIWQRIYREDILDGTGGYGTLSEKEELRRQMFYSIRGFDVLEKYLGDSSISEIMVIGASRIFVEQNGKIRRIEEHFSEEGDVYRLIEQIVAPTNRMVNEACPIVDSRLPDGSRVHIVLPPVSLEGPVITIRKFLKGGMTIEKLLAFEEFPEKLTGILSALVKSRYNILISGATNSGKSSLLNALAEYIGKRERVITIEDSAELQLFHVENLVRLETRNANMEGENEITMQDLIKASLRMRPDRIIVGEVRGAEAMSMLQALSTGQHV